MAKLKPSKSSPIADDADARLARVVERVVRRRSAGEEFLDKEVIQDHPELMPELAERLRVLKSLERAERRAGSGSAALALESIELDLPRDALPGYELMEQVGRGGQGVIYRAIQDGTRRDVAIKVMHEGPLHGAGGKARFIREMRILGQLKHPNIVTIHDTGIASGRAYLVMNYIVGQCHS